MARAPYLPFLPGLTFNANIGRTNFRMDPKFDFSEGVPCLVEKVRPNLFGPLTDRYPSLYARGDVIEVPPWISYNKETLCFDAFFKQTLQEIRDTPFAVRKVKIYFFLEDATILINEPKQENSGITQGVLISRQRIRLPSPMDDNFYDVLDFNIGRELEIFGKFFKLTNCDKFTRHFLNRSGIAVPDPINTPEDPFLTDRAMQKSMMLPKRPNRKVDVFGQFLKNDRKILRFYGYWDDRTTEFGEFHDLEIYYYLADDTLEIKDIIPANAGHDGGGLLMKRGKLPKVYRGLPGVGASTPQNLLNVLGQGLHGRYVADLLNCGNEPIEYYKDNDLSIGGILNCFGRKIVLTDADVNTKEYYRDKYGVSSFVPIQKPVDTIQCQITKRVRELPPWNGFGSYEDSATNCLTVELKAPIKDFKKFLKYDRVGMDSRVLRYEARMISKIPEYCERKFVISYFLADDTIGITELPKAKKQCRASKFLARTEIFMPGQEMLQSKKPSTYQPQHFFVGAQVVINSFQFVLTHADEYALRYMELNPERFPKSDIKVIMAKLREKLLPIYKDFVGEMIPTENNKAITYDKLRSKLCPIMGDNFTEHEMITISRAFSLNCKLSALNHDTIRALALTELRRQLWDDLARLNEYFLLRDPSRTGKLLRKDVYTVLRACRIPLDIQMIEKILDVMEKDENDNICYQNLIDFLNHDKCPLTYTIPINIKSELWWPNVKDVEPGLLIDWCEFNKTLDLESTFQEKPKSYNIIGLEQELLH